MKTITITGLDGSGKSTHAKLLAENLPNSRIVSVWDIITRKEFHSWTVYNFPPNVDRYVVNLDALSRSLFIFHAFHEAYQRAMQSDADFLIFDSDWYKYWAVEQAMGAPAAFGDFLKTQYQTSDYIFYLELSVETALKRKHKLSLYESGDISRPNPEKFLEIQRRAQKIIEDILPEKTIKIDMRKGKDEVHEEIWNILSYMGF